MAKPRSPKKPPTVNETAQSAPVSTGTDAAVAAAPGLAPEPESTRTEPRRTTRKPEIMKANLIPINLENEIRQLAYLYSERRGFEPGHETEDWLTAEREVLQRYHQHSA